MASGWGWGLACLPWGQFSVAYSYGDSKSGQTPNKINRRRSSRGVLDAPDLFWEQTCSHGGLQDSEVNSTAGAISLFGWFFWFDCDWRTSSGSQLVRELPQELTNVILGHGGHYTHPTPATLQWLMTRPTTNTKTCLLLQNHLLMDF